MRREQLDAILEAGEGQSVEFKQSFATEDKAIQTLVAFMNTQGGRVFFGVRPDGSISGVDIGGRRLERLADKIRDQTYPSLGAFIEEPFDYEGKKIVIVEAPSDTPPIVGVYIYSDDFIAPNKPVDASNLQAYRRVGRTNQKDDFMRLRRPQPSDPKLRVSLFDRHNVGTDSGTVRGTVWMQDGSATAHNITFRFDPPLFSCERTYEDLPYPHQGASGVEVRFHARARFRMMDVPQKRPCQVDFIASYKDDWGLVWESSRSLELSEHPTAPSETILIDGGDFSRRIVRFPPKTQ